MDVMISYEIKLPNEAALGRFLNETQQAAEGGYERLLGSNLGANVIAAYDGDLLVAVGAEGRVMVHPQYQQRDIEHNMKKLIRW